MASISESLVATGERHQEANARRVGLGIRPIPPAYRALRLRGRSRGRLARGHWRGPALRRLRNCSSERGSRGRRRRAGRRRSAAEEAALSPTGAEICPGPLGEQPHKQKPQRITRARMGPSCVSQFDPTWRLRSLASRDFIGQCIRSAKAGFPERQAQYASAATRSDPACLGISWPDLVLAAGSAG